MLLKSSCLFQLIGIILKYQQLLSYLQGPLAAIWVKWNAPVPTGVFIL
jgi:hypothetical protein